MALQHAGAAAIHMAVRPYDLLVDGRSLAGGAKSAPLGVALALGRAAEQGRAAHGGGTQAGQCGSLHERAAGQSRLLEFVMVPPLSVRISLSSSRPLLLSGNQPAGGSSAPPAGRIMWPRRVNSVSHTACDFCVSPVQIKVTYHPFPA